MKRLPLILLALVVAMMATTGAASAKTPKTKYHLALGDSLAWGYQQDAEGRIVRSPNGYVNQVFKAARKRTKRLKLVSYGCPGENIKTFVDGNCLGQPLVSVTDTRSQWVKAARFLKKNRKRTALITLSLGANEFTPCAAGASVDIGCVLTGLDRLKAELPEVAGMLRKAAGPRVRIVTHDLFNPYLALARQGGSYAALAFGSLQLVRSVNDAIRASVAPQKIRVAAVAAAFDTFDETVAVDRICALTQNCLPAPQGNIHPNDAGYTVMARAFKKVLRLR